MDNTTIALEELKQHGYRVTKQRESMVDYLGRNQHRYTAVTILDRYMRTQFPESLTILFIEMSNHLLRWALLKAGCKMIRLL